MTSDATGFTPRLIVSLFLCGLVLFIDGYDLAALPLALPHIATALDIAPARFGFALSAVLLGLGVGAVLLAPLGDRFGRRRTIILSVICIGLLTMATATGTSIGGFIVWRLLTGLALGACLPNVTAVGATGATRQHVDDRIARHFLWRDRGGFDRAAAGCAGRVARPVPAAGCRDIGAGRGPFSAVPDRTENGAIG